MTMTSGWHPVALSASIEPATSTGTRVDGKELVVWRDKDGVAHVWEDRCPHRGMKLSFGFVRGDRIACLYHGWQYDAAGQCRYIPAHPDLEVPNTIAVRAFRTAEAAGMIWTTAEPAEPAPAAPEDAGETVPVRSLYVGAEVDAVLAEIEAAPPRPFGDEAPAGGLHRIDDRLHRLAAGADTLLLGLQSVARNRTALHVVIAGPRTSDAGRRQAHFLAWTTGLRHRLEQLPVGGQRIAEPA